MAKKGVDGKVKKVKRPKKPAESDRPIPDLPPGIIEEEVGYNVLLSRGKTVLTITVDLGREGQVSGSGRSIVTASTQGNVAVPGSGGFKIGLNVYRRRERKAKAE